MTSLKGWENADKMDKHKIIINLLPRAYQYAKDNGLLDSEVYEYRKQEELETKGLNYLGDILNNDDILTMLNPKRKT